MLHRFRRAMVRSGRDKLRGTVEIDETYVAITDRSVGRSIKGKKSRTGHAFVAVAVEIIEPKGFGRIRLQRLDRDSAEHVEPFIKGAVAPGSIVKTDGSAAYLDEFAFRFNRRKSGSRGMLFYRLMQQALETAPLTYESVVSAQPKTVQGQVELSG